MFPSDILTETLSAKEAAKIMGCSPQTIRVQCDSGKILGKKVPTKTGDQWRVFKVGIFADGANAATVAEEMRRGGAIPLLNTELQTLADDEDEEEERHYLQPGVVEALALLREERERNAALTQENISLREQLAARPLALPEPEKVPLPWWPPWRRWIRA